jgi:hypothetical protein
MNLMCRMLSVRYTLDSLRSCIYDCVFSFTCLVVTMSLVTLAVIQLRRWRSHGVLCRQTTLAGI